MKRKLLYPFYLLLTTLILLEVAVRIWGYSAHYVYDPIYAPFPASDEIPFVHKPNLVNGRARGQAIINTDSLGLRSLAAGTEHGPKQPEEYRIAIMGDSVTFGEGVRQTANTYPQLLQEQLNHTSHKQVTVFNFGVSAYSVRTMAATLQHRALAIEPDLVLMAVVPQDFDLTRTGVLDEWGYNVSQPARSSRLKYLLRHSHLVYLLRDMIVQWQTRPPLSPAVPWRLPPSYHYLQDFAAIAQANTVPYAIVLLPMWRPDEFVALPAQVAADDLVFVDLLALAGDLSLDDYRATQFDGHPSTLVHERIAAALADYVGDVMGE
jgi:hypothetical protein